MRPATIRRLLVFGVCALGVGALYLMPSVGGSPVRIAPRGAAEPQSVPHPVAYMTQTTTRAADPSLPQRRADRGPRGIAYLQDGGPDRVPPSTVIDLSFPAVTSARLTIRWAAATDDTGVAGYRVWLNGFRVAETAGLQVAVPWFNDGSRQHVVQVRAVDAAGNQSTDAPARVVERPLPVSAVGDTVG